MCGIVGAIAQSNVIEVLLEGLKRLEYRGYDSAGLAVLDENQQTQRIRCLGKVRVLAKAVAEQQLSGKSGIAHTRWATHGKPSENNAHPHQSGAISLVHNGIIENHQALREQLIQAGYVFTSQTDSEVAVHGIHQVRQSGMDLLTAVRSVLPQWQGAYALLIMDNQTPDQLIAARLGSPMVIGIAQHGHFVASDPMALSHLTQQFIYLEEGDIAQISSDSLTIWDAKGQRVQRQPQQLNLVQQQVSKGNYSHFMQKEIAEQPQAIAATLSDWVDNDGFNWQQLESLRPLLSRVQHVQIVACGTSYHAGMTARYWFESLAGVSCSVEVASEFRYRKTVVRPNSLLITLSQSGETADTLAALRLAKRSGYLSTLALCNVENSSLARESDQALFTRAGIEIGVASTKAFTTQLALLLVLNVALARFQQNLAPEQEQALHQALVQLPAQMQHLLAQESQIQALAQHFVQAKSALFLGRGSSYPIALEGALKLMEISYIHAQAYASGELKHGPLALIDPQLPIVVLAPSHEQVDKLAANVEEIRSRGGVLYLFSDASSHFSSDSQLQVHTMPSYNEFSAPILYSLPMQQLAYHVALLKGADIDQPRHLAKAVTVE